MKCVLLYTLDAPSCEVCLFDPGFFHGFNRDFTRGTAEVRASWIRVAFAMMVSALINFFWVVPPHSEGLRRVIRFTPIYDLKSYYALLANLLLHYLCV